MKSSLTGGIDVIGGEGIAAAALDLSHDLIVVLDGDGTIVLTNAAWRANADRRGATWAATGCGVNYLEVCERGDAAVVATGIRAVLRGDLPRFEFDYPCHSPLEDAWFTLEVLAVGEPGAGVVVTHTNITARVAARRPHQHGRDLDPVTMLPTSPAGVTGLAQLLAQAQSAGNSMAVVTITLSDLGDIESRFGRRSRDEVVVQVLGRVRRHIRADDVMIRSSTNQVVLFASVADAQAGDYLRGRISEVLRATYLVGADDIDAESTVVVTSSDQFSTLDSLLPGFSASSVAPSRNGSAAAPGDAVADADDLDLDLDVAAQLPLMVFSLPDGYLQAANDAARSLFGLKPPGPELVHVRDIADPIDVRNTIAAMSALSSGAADSYRAQRTLVTDDGPLVLLTSVRRLVVGAGALAVVLTVPVQPDERTLAATEDPFTMALVAGTIDARGAITSVSAPDSALEIELVDLFGETLRQVAHPDEAERVDTMLASMRSRGSASGTFRLPHSERGWVVCQCQVFAFRRPVDREPSAPAPVVERDTSGFVLSVNVSTRPMADRIARLERHIRRIGSEVHAADLQLAGGSSSDPGMSAVLEALAPTERQRDIVERLARGQRVASIAAELYISRSTVRNHLAQVYRRAGVHSQDELLNALRAR